MQPWHIWAFIGICLWAGLIGLGAALSSSRLREDDLGADALCLFMRIYARVMHHLRIEGREHIPEPVSAGSVGYPLIVAANHTAGVDPVLIQAAIRFEPRWMMAEDMRAPKLDWLWNMARIIFVDRANRDSRSAREALRHLKASGVLGVFPEGHIERPPEHLLPFRGGIGFLIAKSGAAVLPVIITGTPQIDPAWAGLTRPSRSVVRFLPIVRYPKDMTPDAIGADLHRRFAEATGWPPAPRVPMIGPHGSVFIGLDGRYIDDDGNPITDEQARALVAEPPTQTPPIQTPSEAT